MSNAADIEAIQARLHSGYAPMITAERSLQMQQDIADLLHDLGNVEQRAGLVDEILARNEALQAALTRSEQLAAERAEALEAAAVRWNAQVQSTEHWKARAEVAEASSHGYMILLAALVNSIGGQVSIPRVHLVEVEAVEVEEDAAIDAVIVRARALEGK